MAKVATKPIEVSLVTKSLNYLDVHQLDLIGGTVEGPPLYSKMKLPLTKQKPKAAMISSVGLMKKIKLYLLILKLALAFQVTAH